MGELSKPPSPLRLHFGSAPDNLKASQPSVARATVLGKAVGTLEKLEVSGCHSKGRRKANAPSVISSPGSPPRAPLRPSQPCAWSAPGLRQGRGSRAGSRLPPAGPPPPPPPHRHPEPGREPGRAAIMLSRLGALLQEAVGAVSPGPGRAGEGGRGPGAGWVRAPWAGPLPGPDAASGASVSGSCP